MSEATQIWSAVIVFKDSGENIGAANSLASTESEAFASAFANVPDGATLLLRRAISTGVQFVEVGP